MIWHLSSTGIGPVLSLATNVCGPCMPHTNKSHPCCASCWSDVLNNTPAQEFVQLCGNQWTHATMHTTPLAVCIWHIHIPVDESCKALPPSSHATQSQQFCGVYQLKVLSTCSAKIKSLSYGHRVVRKHCHVSNNSTGHNASMCILKLQHVCMVFNSYSWPSHIVILRLWHMISGARKDCPTQSACKH